MRVFGFKHRMLSAAILAALSLIIAGVSLQAAPQAGFAVTSRPASLAFFSQIGSAAPAPQTIQISDNSSNCKAVTVTTDQAWLAVTPNRGCAALHPRVSINAAGLAAGTYAGGVTISSNARGNSQLRVPVSLTITPGTAVPPLSITTTSLLPGQVGIAYSASLAATGGVPPYNWTATGLAAGLALSATGGVSGTPTQAGTLGELFSVADSARTATSTTLSLTIAAAATVSYTLASKPVAAAFSWQIGNAAPASQVIQVVDNSPPGSCEAVTITTDQGWLAATPNSGCAGLNTTVSVSTAGLAAGNYAGSVVVSSPSETNSPFRVPVSFTIAPATVVPPLSITTTSLPSGQVGTAYSATLAATGGVPPYSWAATGLAAGLAISASGGVSGTPTQTGTFSELLSVTYSNGATSASATLPVTIASAATVSYTLASQPASAAFSWQVGSAQSWLAVTPNSGCTAFNATVSINTAALAAGSYAGNVIVSGTAETNSPFRVPVSLVVTTAVSPPSVYLSWSASTSQVAGYNLYRTASSGGNYAKVTSGLVVIMNYTDGSVVSGNTYYYVVTAVDSSNVESVYSNSASAIIP